MSGVMWGLIPQYANAGQEFGDAFSQGMQRNALSALAMNPNDPRAQQGAAPYAPQAVMQARQHQQELTQQEHDAWVKTLGAAAKMADTPEKWDQAVDWFVSQGHPEAAQFKGKFSPGLRDAFMAQAGIFDDKPAQPHFVPFQQGGGVLQVNPDGGTQMLVQPNDGSHPAGAAVASGVPAEAAARLRSNPNEATQFDEIFGAGAAQKILGGQTGSAPSANFP